MLKKELDYADLNKITEIPEAIKARRPRKKARQKDVVISTPGLNNGQIRFNLNSR